MRLRNIGLALGLAGLGIAANSMSARALDFSFSFTVLESGNPVTISGDILGVDNTGVAEHGIYITSAPGLFISSTDELTQESGTFTVSNGTISAISKNILYDDNNTTNDGVILVLNQFESASSPQGYYNEIIDSVGNPAFSSPASSISKNTAFTVTAYNFQQIPWEFNPGEMVGLGVPLMMGLGVLKKKLVLK